MEESSIAFIVIGISVVCIGLAVALGLFLRKGVTKVKDADLPGQIENIIKKVCGENYASYDSVPAKTTQTASGMIKDAVISSAVKAVTGHTINLYEPGDDFLIIFGLDKLFFVPYYFDLKTKTFKPNYDKMSEIDKNDLLKIKNNKSYSSITFTYSNNTSLHFGAVNQYEVNIPSPKESRQAFNSFMDKFVSQVNQ